MNVKIPLGLIVKRHGGAIQTGPFGSQLHQAEYTVTGIPVVMPKDINGGRISIDSIARVSEEKAAQLSRHYLSEGEIVFPRRGDIEKCAFVTKRESGYLCGTGCIRIQVNSHFYASKFLYYFLLLKDSSQWLQKHAVGTTMLNLNTGILSSIPVPDIPLPVQTRIAEILSAYDDLIENNRRQIKLLEESARLLYREWFVQLRFPGHEQLNVVDGVPEGWKRGQLSTIMDVNPDSLKKGFTGVIQYIDISSVSTGKIDSATEYVFEDAPSRARRKVKHGDTIWSCVRPNLRAYAMVTQPEENLIVSTGFAVLRPKSLAAVEYLYCVTTTDDFVTYLGNVATGTSYPAVTQDDFTDAMILLPPESLLESFSSLTVELFNKSATLQGMNKKLSAARDLLLPRLMSGELEV